MGTGFTWSHVCLEITEWVVECPISTNKCNNPSFPPKKKQKTDFSKFSVFYCKSYIAYVELSFHFWGVIYTIQFLYNLPYLCQISNQISPFLCYQTCLTCLQRALKTILSVFLFVHSWFCLESLFFKKHFSVLSEFYWSFWKCIPYQLVCSMPWWSALYLL